MSYITPKELLDASIDAGTLEKFALGGVGQPNINRNGNNVFNLATINDQVMRIGNAIPFGTEAKLQADQVLPVGAWAVVLNDPDEKKNGFYQRQEVGWQKTIQQPASGALLEEVSDLAASSLDLASMPSALSGDFFPFGLPKRRPIITDEDGKQIFSIDEHGLQVKGWVADFHDGSSEISLCFTDENGVVLIAWDTKGKMVVGGGSFDFKSLAHSVEGLGPGTAWNDHGRLAILAEQDSFFRSDPVSMFTHASVVHGLYDDLMAQFPDYIAKRQLGEDGLGNPIYEYSFKPADYHTLWYHEAHPELIAKPKVCIIGGTHGNERHAIATNYTMMREIAVNWRNNPISAALRWGCHIVIVPILTPSGFNSQSRYNHNGVDVNRNYPTRWETASGPKGASPLSELEAQAAVQFMTDHPDACAFIDTHNAGGLSSTGYAFWVGTERGQTLGSALKVLNHMAEFGKREYSFVVPDNSPIVRLTASGDGTAAKHVQHAFGRNGFLVETGAGFGANYYERERHALEGVRQLVYQTMKQENQRRIREYDFTWLPIDQSETDDD